jgi:hypothetical protein
VDRRELRDGYRCRVAEQSISLTDIAEWVRLERACCPFLVFAIDIVGAKPELH